jgi:5-methylcytosine-specific restriction endonuclease McrA
MLPVRTTSEMNLILVTPPAAAAPSAEPAAAPPAKPAAVVVRTSIEPLDADHARVHMTVSRRLLAKLEQARAALSHSHPGAGQDEILEVGLDLIIERHAKRRGLVKNPRNPRTAPTQNAGRSVPRPRADRKRERVPAHVMRAVWKRDDGRCQWPVDGGGICGSTHQVEFDHIVPVARGGPSTEDNGRLLCRPHQDLAARQVFGDGWMDLFTRRRSAPAVGS